MVYLTLNKNKLDNLSGLTDLTLWKEDRPSKTFFYWENPITGQVVF